MSRTKPKRFVVEKLSRASIATWRRVVDTDLESGARAAFLAHSTNLKSGTVRLVDTVSGEVLARVVR